MAGVLDFTRVIAPLEQNSGLVRPVFYFSSINCDAKWSVGLHNIHSVRSMKIRAFCGSSFSITVFPSVFLWEVLLRVGWVLSSFIFQPKSPKLLYACRTVFNSKVGGSHLNWNSRNLWLRPFYMLNFHVRLLDMQVGVTCGAKTLELISLSICALSRSKVHRIGFL